MRASPSPVRHPMGDRLPGIYLGNDFVQNLTSALDDVLAPVFAVLDGFAEHIDPRLAPPQFVDWLATWVALDVDERWDTATRRDLVAGAVAAHRRRGTAAGLTAHVAALTGGRVEVVESGACAAGLRGAGSPLPGTDPARVHVLVRVADPSAVDNRSLTAAVAEHVPAHVAVSVEVVAS